MQSSLSPVVQAPKRFLEILYAVTIFLSAFLLFQVQPIIAKMILPWFGGSSAVWSTCMLFFQVVLLLGYLYAHWLQSRPAARQAMHHIGAAGGQPGCAADRAESRPGNRRPADNPSLRILGLLAVTVGCLIFCCPPPARCCRPGTRARMTAWCRTGCSRSPISPRCWRC